MRTEPTVLADWSNSIAAEIDVKLKTIVGNDDGSLGSHLSTKEVGEAYFENVLA